MKKFLTLLELKQKARKEVRNHIQNWEKSKKIINTLFGVSGINKKWLNSAKKQYRASLSRTGFDKSDLLIGALFEIYKVNFLIHNSKFNDHQISDLVKKYETKYLNFILNFVENNTNNLNDILSLYQPLQESIEVLKEKNSQLANFYFKRLQEAKLSLDFKNRIYQILNIDTKEFNQGLTQKISKLYTKNEDKLSHNPELFQEIYNRVNQKLNKIYRYYYDKFSTEYEKNHPSLNSIISILKEYSNIINPIKNLIKNDELRSFSDNINFYLNIYNFIENKYPVLRQTYQFYQYKNRKIDPQKIDRAIQELSAIKSKIAKNYIELQQLKPSLNDMISFFNSISKKFYENDLIEYYKIYNKIIEMSSSIKKANQLIKFYHELNRLKKSMPINNNQNKITTLISTVKNDVIQLLKNLLTKNIKKAQNTKDIKKSFDPILESFYNLKDLEQIEWVQNYKKKLLSDVEKISKLIAEIEYKFEKDKINNLPKDLKDLNQTLTPIENYRGKEIVKAPNLLNSYSNLHKEGSSSLNRLIVIDKYSSNNYIVFTKNIITLGRNDENDIIIDNEWISGNHCYFDALDKEIKDLDSTNGTFVNNNKIQNFDLFKLKTFNIADQFDFSFAQKDNCCSVIQLKNVNNNKINESKFVRSLESTKFIWLTDSSSFQINKNTGKILPGNSANKDSITIEFQNNAFFISDLENNVNKKKIDSHFNSLEQFTFRLD